MSNARVGELNPKLVRSAPALKAFPPSPLTTTTRMEASAAASLATDSSSSTNRGVIVLSRCGRLRVTHAMGGDIVSTTSSSFLSVVA